MMEFMHDDLPDPVAPEMRMCGISARFAMTARPAMSRPMRHLERVRVADGLASFESRMSPQGDELARPVRHLDADGRLAGDRAPGCARRATPWLSERKRDDRRKLLSLRGRKLRSIFSASTGSVSRYVSDE